MSITWQDRIAKGLAGRQPALPNMAYSGLPLLRIRVARWLVKLAARIDCRPDVRYSIERRSPADWSNV